MNNIINRILEESVKISRDYPELSYKEVIELAEQVIQDETNREEDDRMINLDRFENQFLVQLDDIQNGDNVRELSLTKEDIEDGMLSDIFEDEGIFIIDEEIVSVEGGIVNDSFMDVDGAIECRIFVNGLVVKDIEKELGIR